MRPSLAFALAFGAGLMAQPAPGIQEAMAAELARSMRELALPGLQKPFFIAYTLRVLEVTSMRATLGALVASTTWRNRDNRVDLLVGDAFRNNAHFVDPQALFASNATFASLPLEDDGMGIRTAFWLATDERYKGAAETFEHKLTTLRQQQLPEAWATVPDLDPAPAAIRTLATARRVPVDTGRWEKTLRDISAVLLKHPDIQASEASFHFVQGERHYLSSQNANVLLPVGLAALHVSLKTQAEDGAPLTDCVVYYGRTPGELPDPSRAMKDVEDAAAHLEALRTARPLEASYGGPVLFEDQAVGELFAQRFFSPQAPGMVSVRKPLFSDAQTEAVSRKMPESLEDKLEVRVLPRGFTVTAAPHLESFEGTPLIGAYPLDAEAVAPAREVLLVDKGTLKNLLCGRAPTPTCPASNGHQRPVLDPFRAEDAPGPGVIEFRTREGTSLDELRRDLLRLAKDAGLKHAYIVRKLRSQVTDPGPNEWMPIFPGQSQGPALGLPIQLFRISVDTGSTEPVRGGEIPAVPLFSLRHILGASAQRFAHNALMTPISVSPQASYPYLGRYGWCPRGVPASFIVPRAVLFEELDLRRETLPTAPRPPVTPNPLEK